MRKIKTNIQPDFTRILKVLHRSDVPDRVPLYEWRSDIQNEVLLFFGAELSVRPPPDILEYQEWDVQRQIKYMSLLGYDYADISAKNLRFTFPVKERAFGTTDQGERGYIRGEDCIITNRQDFEKYPWPKIEDVNYGILEKVQRIIPEGMKVIAGGSGILENTMWILGYEGISYLLYDDPKLLEDIFHTVGSLIVRHIDNLADSEVVGAIKYADDMGFKTQTLLSPENYRKYLFPWHKKVVETAHKHCKPILLHACGNLSEIMDDIITCGWDAKHSFEDSIEPVWLAKKRYGDRISLLGGFDINKLATISEKEVRNHTHFLIDRCSPGGGWALGSGNSIANYVPVRNFLAMVEEGLNYGRY